MFVPKTPSVFFLAAHGRIGTVLPTFCSKHDEEDGGGLGETNGFCSENTLRIS